MAIDKGLKAGAQDTYEGVERATDDLAEVADAVKVSEGLAVELSYTSSNSSALLEPSEVRENLDFTLVVKFVGETWKWASPISAKMGGSVINE
eukprot:CAMPEP_0185581064 /NCGR_PEP_ID=MMETSP0434-20130131/18077_1 /TAXON_ID=626734 ORGANISM="Favella taraikaensis, Strain Fe Narragansett Bay" /NCGR_SAMPLE_ID=MMETSP0434 /ASSEMBLY_ACC=CAM_ASM_000379 /LENGTH=92 /DNA_ID=CAMNT_0028199507 /DNA_START=1138 /DNA_END=1417 /DNA_ORIENTATION=+